MSKGNFTTDGVSRWRGGGSWRKKTVEEYESEATWVGGCLTHPSAHVARRIYILRHSCTLSAEEFVCHTCDNPPCILDSHHFLGDALANTTDMMTKGRHRNDGSGPTSSLTAKEVAEIRASTLTHRKLAVMYGRSQSYISKIKRGCPRKGVS